MEETIVMADAKLHSDYLKLIRQFPLRAITSQRRHDAAMKMVAELALRDEADLSSGQRDYLRALTVLLEDYDRRQTLPPSDLTEVDLLRHLMHENGLTVSDLGRIIGSQPNASLILSGHRQMSKTVIQKLAAHFAVNPGLFLRGTKEAA